MNCSYKWCYVPMCPNTTITSPQKVFVVVPKKPAIRKKWMMLARRDPNTIPKLNSVIFCCEDHLDLEKDVKNWMEHKMMGGRIFLKEDVLPTRFECQNRGKTVPLRSLEVKKKILARKELVEQLIAESDAVAQSDTVAGSDAVSESNAVPNETIVFPECAESVERSEFIKNKKCEVGTQVLIKPHIRSKMVQCNFGLKREVVVPVIHSTINAKRQKTDDIFSSSSETDGNNLSDQGTDETDSEKESLVAAPLTMKLIQRNFRLYLGIPDQCKFLIKFLEKHTSVSSRNIMIILRKIRLNETFSLLADYFDLSISSISRIFSKDLFLIYSVMKFFISQPKPEKIFQNLPIPFRFGFSSVSFIIDCFEVKIEKPLNALHQALTWSEYKHSNTLKYLISTTPDGLITFISEGYGGRTSDIMITSDSGFLNSLSPGTTIMADRGFKQIETLLAQKNCQLIRPPSVSSDEKLSEDVILGRKIASLRVHVERVIRRVREFKLLDSHVSVDHNFIPYLDRCIIVACGLVNFQDYLIKC